MPKKRITPQPCPMCGELFAPFATDARRGKGKVCSSACRSASFRTVVETEAPYVGPSSKKHSPWRERFWRKVNKTEECWVWLAYVDHGGYGRFCKTGAVAEYAHKIAYEEEVGKIDEGLEFDHLCHTNDPSCPGGRCRHRRCVRPSHLEPVTHRVNALRGQGYYAKSARRAILA